MKTWTTPGLGGLWEDSDLLVYLVFTWSRGLVVLYILGLLPNSWPQINIVLSIQRFLLLGTSFHKCKLLQLSESWFYLLSWARQSQDCLSFCITSENCFQVDARVNHGIHLPCLHPSKQPRLKISVVQCLQVMFNSFQFSRCQQWDGGRGCNYCLLAENTTY